MADQKISELTELTTPADEDLLAIVDDPGGSPVTKKITFSNLKANVDSYEHWIMGETPTGDVDGSNTAYDTANNYISGKIEVFRDGQRMEGGGADYTETDSNTITFTTAPTTGSVITVNYLKGGVAVGDADTLDGQHASELSPTGMVVPFAGASAPSGWLLADGSAVSRSTYSALFTVISTTYGSGDGSTTFNLPDLKGRVAVGKSTDTEFDTLGEKGGAKTHTLQLTEVPAHTHAVMTVLIHCDGTQVTDEYINASLAYGTARRRYSNYEESRGGGLAHNNLQPYITLNYIIKT